MLKHKLCFSSALRTFLYIFLAYNINDYVTLSSLIVSFNWAWHWISWSLERQIFALNTSSLCLVQTEELALATVSFTSRSEYRSAGGRIAIRQRKHSPSACCRQLLLCVSVERNPHSHCFRFSASCHCGCSAIEWSELNKCQNYQVHNTPLFLCFVLLLQTWHAHVSDMLILWMIIGFYDSDWQNLPPSF